MTRFRWVCEEGLAAWLSPNAVETYHMFLVMPHGPRTADKSCAEKPAFQYHEVFLDVPGLAAAVVPRLSTHIQVYGGE